MRAHDGMALRTVAPESCLDQPRRGEGLDGAYQRAGADRGSSRSRAARTRRFSRARGRRRAAQRCPASLGATRRARGDVDSRSRPEAERSHSVTGAMSCRARPVASTIARAVVPSRYSRGSHAPWSFDRLMSNRANGHAEWSRGQDLETRAKAGLVRRVKFNFEHDRAGEARHRDDGVA